MSIRHYSTYAGRAARLLKRRVLGRWAEFRTPEVLDELARVNHPEAQTLAKSLAAVRGGFYGGGDSWAKRIEAERAKLLASRQSISEATQTSSSFDQGVTVRGACRASRRREDGLLLYALVRALRPRRVVELGTNVGISSAYMGAALTDNGLVDGVQGSLITLDASPGRSGTARRVHEALGLAGMDYRVGFFQDTLDSALGENVDFAFIDGHHNEQATIDYFERIHAKANPNAAFVFDDIRWSAGMERAWKKLQGDRRFGIVIDLCGLGVALSGDAQRERAPFSTPILRV